MADEQGQQQDSNIMYIWKFPISRSYVKSMDSIIKLIAAVLSLIAFICAASGRSDNCDDSYSSTYNFFEFVSMSSFLTLMILWFFYTLTLNTKLFFKLLPWFLVDLIYCAVYVLFYLLGSILIAAQSCGKDSNKAAAAFGFFTLGCYCGNAFLDFKGWRSGGGHQPQSDANKSPDYNAERNMEQY